MNIGNILWTCFFIWCIPNNEKVRIISLLIKFYYKFDHFMDFCNQKLYPDYFLNDSSDEEEKEEKEEKEIKYEDKYLEEIRKLSKEFHFDTEEEETKTAKYIEYWKEIIKNNAEKLAVLTKKLNKIIKKLDKIDKIEKEEDEYYVYSDDSDSSNELTLTDKILQVEKEVLLKEIRTLQTQIESEEGQNEIIQKARDLSHEYVVNQRLEKIKNCYIMECTPLGNVLMIYDTTRSTFKYFSDNSIPYRYLETVARKYVKCYNCRPIFVDMEEELKIAEEKWEKERKEKEQKEIVEEERKKVNKPVENKKSVFAKFKSYNNSKDHKTMAVPPKNSIPNNKALTKEQENEKILLKERANRYTYEGKISNFSFLKKVERKIVDKKYGMSFADFKKMQKK